MGHNSTTKSASTRVTTPRKWLLRYCSFGLIKNCIVVFKHLRSTFNKVVKNRTYMSLGGLRKGNDTNRSMICVSMRFKVMVSGGLDASSFKSQNWRMTDVLEVSILKIIYGYLILMPFGLVVLATAQ